MPELPEVETVKNGLQRLIVGKIVADVHFDWPKGFPNTSADVDQFLIGAKIAQVRRRAKVLLIDLSSSYTLVCHLKMTGQMVYRTAIGGKKKSPSKNQDFGAGHPNDSLIGELPDKSTRVIITFKDDSKLFFNDQRKFGWMRLLPTAQVPELDFFKKVGPEPLSGDFTAEVLHKRLQKRKNSSIKAALLDQTVLAGIGNIYADESLWGAKIHPATLVKNVTKVQTKLLHKQIQYVLKLAIQKGGSTNKNYVNAEGKKGSYMSFAKVFRRQDQPCPRCNTIIHKSRVAGRGTHTCPK